MYLFDTDILSNLIKRAPSVVLIRRLATTPEEHQYTSSITLGEMLYGAHRLGERGEILLRRIEELFALRLSVVPFDAEAARHYGRLRAELERAGTPLADADLRIAAIALARDLTLVTGNTKHFARVPDLQIENWLA